MIDLHSHILPGIDDGARTVEDSREIARHAVAEETGDRRVAATGSGCATAHPYISDAR